MNECGGCPYYHDCDRINYTLNEVRQMNTYLTQCEYLCKCRECGRKITKGEWFYKKEINIFRFKGRINICSGCIKEINAEVSRVTL